MSRHSRALLLWVALTLALALTAPLALAAPAAFAAGPSPAAPLAVPEGEKAVQNTRGAPLQAFVLSSSPDSFTDLQAHVGAIGVIYPTYFQCAIPSGRLSGVTDPEIDAYAGAHGLQELPRVNCQDGATVHRILTVPYARARALARMVTLADDTAYAGLDLDFENDGAADRGALDSFVAALAARLHREHRKLAVDVDGVVAEDPHHATYFYDDRALAAAADTVFVMAWGSHWERSAPGPIAPLPYVRAVAERLAVLPHARRFVLGVPMYGLDWPGRGGRAEPASALQDGGVLKLAGAVGVTPVRALDSGEMTFAYRRVGVEHHVWFMDASAIAERLAIARSLGLTAGVWRLGEEDQTLWGLPGI